MVDINCKNCGKLGEHHAKGMCLTCYKRLEWKPKLVKCKRCERILPMHARGLCMGCYNSVFHIDKTKEYNYRKLYNLDLETYKKITGFCAICGFDKVINLHHLDKNRQNNSSSNLIGLCPNHHMMLHDRRFRNEIFEMLKKKGYTIPEIFYKDDEFFKT